MGINAKILKRLVHWACAKAGIRQNIIDEITQNHMDAFVGNALNYDSNKFLSLMAESMRRQSDTDQELNLLTHSANFKDLKTRRPCFQWFCNYIKACLVVN